jgi:hypothetical protein
MRVRAVKRWRILISVGPTWEMCVNGGALIRDRGSEAQRLLSPHSLRRDLLLRGEEREDLVLMRVVRSA